MMLYVLYSLIPSRNQYIETMALGESTHSKSTAQLSSKYICRYIHFFIREQDMIFGFKDFIESPGDVRKKIDKMAVTDISHAP